MEPFVSAASPFRMPPFENAGSTARRSNPEAVSISLPMQTRVTASVLLVVDDKESRRRLADTLKATEFGVRGVATGTDALLLAGGDWEPDVIVVDLLVPRLETYGTCRALRSTFAVPLILVAGENAIGQRAPAEADELLAKPFTDDQLASRIRAVCRRGTVSRDAIAAGDLVLFPQERRVFLRNREIEVSADEFALLLRLVASRGESVTRHELVASLRRVNCDIDPRIVDTYLIRLMVRLGEHGSTRVVRTNDREGFVLLASGRGIGRQTCVGGVNSGRRFTRQTIVG